MESSLMIDLPISAIICDSCKDNKEIHECSRGNMNFITNVAVPDQNRVVHNDKFTVQVDVKKIVWNTVEKGIYATMAQMLVMCPKCDKQHVVKRYLVAPRAYLEQSRTCVSCGGDLSFQEESLDIEDCRGKPFITITGTLKCEKCKNEIRHSAGGGITKEKDGNGGEYTVMCGKGQKLHISL